MMTSRIRKKRKSFPRTWQNIVFTLLLGILIVFSFPILSPVSRTSPRMDPDNSGLPSPTQKVSSSSVTGSGNDINSIMTFSRNIQSPDIDIMNSYANTSSHAASIDLSSYQLPGWTLYEVQVDANSITAIAEREVLGVSKDISSFKIEEYNSDFGWRSTSLAQGFYEMPHDGQLLNYSFYYDSPIYNPAQHGWAYYSVLSDYQDSSSNLVGYTQLPTRVISGAGWENATVAPIVLGADTQYYAVINGSTLIKTSYYPDIQWIAESGAGTFASQQYDSRFTAWGSFSCEALLNYTYIPWNTTANAALVFANPSSIAFNLNGTPASGSTWTISSANNITALQISTNQSVSVEYDLTLKYRKNSVSTVMWYADTSETNVTWNITSVLDYPELSGILDRNLTLSLPSDWTAIHLFKEITPTVYHDIFTQDNSAVICSQLSDATWILECSSPNYVKSMQKFDNSDDSIIYDQVSVTVTLDINSTIEDSISTPVVNGNSYLRIFHQSTLEYSDNVAVTVGKSHHQWDISLHSTTNGLHIIELYWTNGTEVGYHTNEVVVYYPTVLSAESYSIEGFTESSVEISVYFEDTFTAQGLDGDESSIVYSFAGESNTNLTDHNNGTWTASISTAGRIPDTYDIQVFAEGYAIENKSVTIYTTLIHDTEALTILWFDSNNISFVDTTELRVEYTRVGDIPVVDAMVNVTIDGVTIQLTWDSDLSLYKLTFNGTDIYSGFGTYILTINAWKAGHKAQVDTTQEFTIHPEFTDFTINWSHGTDITYIEYTILTVSYRMSNTSAIPAANVSVTDGITTWPLHWNNTGEVYWIQFNGTDSNPGYGTHPLTIQASKFGYESHENPDYSLSVRKVPTSLVLTWSDGNTITYVQTTTLAANYTMLDGTPVIDAIVNVTIGTDFWTLEYNPLTRTYNLILNGSDTIPGFGFYSVAVLAGLTGYDGKSNDAYSFTIDLESTTLSVTWSAGFDISYVQQTTLNVTYLMSNGTPIEGAVINVTINGHLWNMTWDGSTSYLLVFNGTDTLPGFGTHDLTILVGKYGYENQIENNEDIILSEESTSVDTEWLGNLSIITYAGSTTLSINYTMSDGSPVEGAVVYATIDTTTWNLTWNIPTRTYQWIFYGTDNPPDLGTHTVVINASRYGFDTGYDSTTLTIDDEPTTLNVELLPSDEFTYKEGCIVSVSYTMNSNNSAITDAIVYATIAGVQRQMVWNLTTLTYYLYIDGDTDLQNLSTYSVEVEASKYGFVSGVNSSRYIILNPEPTTLSVRWASDINNPDFYSYTYLIVEYTYGSSISVLYAKVNVTIGTHTWSLEWNVDEDYYQLRFNGSDSIPGVGTHTITVKAWKYGFIDQTNIDEEIVIPLISTQLDLMWTNGDNITYVERTTLQAFYTMYNSSLILGAEVNITINGVTLSLDWNDSTYAYERTFFGSDSLLDFATYPISVLASQSDFQSQSNSTMSFTKQLEPTSLIISWIGGNNITYFSQTRLSVQFIMSNGSPISTGILNVTIGGILLNLDWNSTSSTYEVVIFGDDNRLDYLNYSVLVNASSFGFVPAEDTSQTFTIRLEDTYLSFEWNPDKTISYLEVAILRIYYRYETNHSPVLEADVNATFTITWIAVYNESSGAYEIAFTGSEILNPIDGPYTFDVYASKKDHLSLFSNPQNLTVVQEDTSIQTFWLNDDNTISFVESTTIFVNYSITSSGASIVNANVTVRIGTTTWQTVYNNTLELYSFTYTGDMDPPGLGTFTLYISATYVDHDGFKDASDNSKTLVILSETVNIHSYWIGGGIINYVGSTILVVNYTMSNGFAISEATVNVTIGLNYWIVPWHESSQTYRMIFNGSDSPPDLGYHELDIRANKDGFDTLTSTISLEIIKEPSTVTYRWSDPYQNNITYFEYTYLFVEYSMSNGSLILDASVNVTIDLDKWVLEWNITEQAYGIRFNGSEVPPGFGNHTLVIEASKFGFALAGNLTSFDLNRDPTSIDIFWSNGNDISFVENTTLMVYYRMSNSSPILTALVEASIGEDSWILTWNASAQAYCITFNGTMNPPGIDRFTVEITATGDIFASQFNITEVEIHEEPTSVIPSWTVETIDWTQSLLLYVEYRDSYGRLIDEVTQKVITIDGMPYTLSGSDGTYWFEFNNTFGLELHLIEINISKYGYEFASNTSISIEIIDAPTELVLLWNTKTIDYLGQIELFANYSCYGSTVPQGDVVANITIDGSIFLPLEISGEYWVINLTGMYLDLGPHSITINAQAYGYSFAEEVDILTVNEVVTDALSITWNPSNITIEYTESIELVIDYTFYGGDVSDNASVDVSLNSQVYNLNYSSGAWRVTINGSEISIGIYDASISALLYGYAQQTNITTGVNVTAAANWFHVQWEPSSLVATYVDTINISVIYTQDFEPIYGASVYLSLNGTLYELVYSSFDKKWHYNISAASIGLGIWNATVTANKTGYTDGWYSNYLVILNAVTTLDVNVTSPSVYYDESVEFDIYYLMSNLSYVPDGVLIISLEGEEQTFSWDSDHWTGTLDVAELGIGEHNFTITVNAFGFEGRVESILITILPIPTEVVYNDAIVLSALETFTLRFTYLDSRTDTGIVGAIANIDWSDAFTILDLGNGTYVVEMGGSSLHIGNYTFEITLEKTGYVNRSGTVDIEVIPISTDLLVATHITQYENETIIIEARFIVFTSSNPVIGANIIANLIGVEYRLVYDSETGNYTLTIQLPRNMIPDSYSISIYAEAIDYESGDALIEVYVLVKSTYTLILDVAQESQTGEELVITITALDDSLPVGGISLTLYIKISSESGSRVHTQEIVTDENGAVIVTFEVPSDASNLEIFAKYEGSISSWSVESTAYDVEITSGESGFLNTFLGDPVMLSILIGGISLPLLGLVALRRRRGILNKIIESPMTPAVEASFVSSTIVEPFDRLKEEIAATDSGLTRAELSERLGLSSTKIGILVKDLLASDSGFYEVREGRKRIIMKR